MSTVSVLVAFLAGGTAVALGSSATVRARLPRLPTAAWLAVGLVVGAIFAPVAAQATGALTQIVGSSGTPAGVSLANRLLTSEASPAATHGYHFWADSGSCAKVMAAPAEAGYILKQIEVDTYTDPTPGSGDAVEIFGGAGCSGFPLAAINPESVGMSSFTFNPGQALKPGASIYAYTAGSMAAEVWLQGYTVPKAAVVVSSSY